MSLIEEAHECLKDGNNCLWSPKAHKDLIRRMAERMVTLESKARAFDNWQANTGVIGCAAGGATFVVVSGEST